MTKLAVSIVVRSLEDALTLSESAKARGADLVEFRIDEWAFKGDELERLILDCPLASIVTCRPEFEGGVFPEDEEARRKVFEKIGEARPTYIDAELAAYLRADEFKQTIKQIVDHPGQVGNVGTGLILSSHDFETRPPDLLQRLEAMTATPACRVIKMAWRARSLRDNLEAFELIAASHKPTIAICMGEFGFPSRVLARKFGALLTFCGMDDSSIVAPGQVGLDTMFHRYRWKAIDGATKVYGVIGWPVEHSLSPHIHNAGFDATAYNGVYLPMPIPPEYEHFKATVGAWLDFDGLDFKGASVTIPHKENLIRFVKEEGGEVEELAERIGAANTLTVREDGSLYASNTDYAAALYAGCNAMEISPQKLKKRSVGVIGAGGAAKAVVAGFSHSGCELVIYNRTKKRAEELADTFADAAGALSVGSLDDLACSSHNIYVNCTPLGMWPNVNETPMEVWPKSVGKKTLAFDTVYNPGETRWLREARKRGCLTVSGVEMFVLQAAAQFELWTGEGAPADIFHSIVDMELEKRREAEG